MQSRFARPLMYWYTTRKRTERATRAHKRTSTSLEAFDAPAVKIAPIETFDANGIGTEPNNLAAIESLKVYRTVRWGRHFELILTDQYSHRS